MRCGRRHIEIACKVEGHRSRQDPTDNRDVAIAVAPDPLDQLVKRVRVGEDVVGGLPIGVLVGIAKARHSERRAVGKRSSEV